MQQHKSKLCSVHKKSKILLKCQLFLQCEIQNYRIVMKQNLKRSIWKSWNAELIKIWNPTFHMLKSRLLSKQNQKSSFSVNVEYRICRASTVWKSGFCSTSGQIVDGQWPLWSPDHYSLQEATNNSLCWLVDIHRYCSKRVDGNVASDNSCEADSHFSTVV